MFDVAVPTSTGSQSHIVYPVSKLTEDFPDSRVDEIVQHVLQDGAVVNGKLEITFAYCGRQICMSLVEKFAKREAIVRIVVKRGIRELAEKIPFWV